jgi:hypothetical protein
VLAGLAGPLAAWPAPARQAAFWLAAALAVSIFWSLQTLVYLHLRAAIDREPASTLASDSSPDEPDEPPPAEAPAEEAAASTPGVLGGIARTVKLLALAAGSWWLTAWLFARAGGAEARWLGWGVGERFVPPAPGLYRSASLIAALWGILWLALALWAAVRAGRRGAALPAGSDARSIPGRQERVNR